MARFLLYSRAPVVASDQGRRAGNWNRGQPCARRGCRGAGSRGTTGPFFICAQDSRDKKKPGIAGLFAEAPTPGRAGTGGIQISPPDVDIEPLLPLTSESDATGQLIVRSLRRQRGESNGRTPSAGCFSAPADGWHSPSVRMTVAAAARDAPLWPVPGAPCAVAAARPHAARRVKKSRGEDDSHPHSCVAGWATASPAG